MAMKTDREERLIADAIDWYEVHHADTDRNEHETSLKCAIRDVIAERAIPPPDMPIIRDTPDGPILPGFDPRTGRKVD